MSSTYTFPGVYVQELTSPVHPITGVATSIAAFVGYTATGIDNRAEKIFSFSDYQRLFGGLAPNSELSYAVQQFFLNGGSQAWVVRTPGHYENPPASEPPYAQVVFGNLTFRALSSGAWANGKLLIDIDVQGLNLPPGPVIDPLAFNLTVTNLSTKTTEYFSSLTLNSNSQNFVANVINDPDNGSQLVNVDITSLPPLPGTPPLTVTGVVGTALSFTGAGGVNTLLGSPASPTTASADCSLVLNLPPSFVPPLPPIKVISSGAAIPQSVQGLASQLQTAINSVLAVKMPGSSVSCVAAPVWNSGTFAGMGMRVNVMLPNMPDAVVNFSSPPSVSPTVNDAAGALGLLAQGELGGTLTAGGVATLLGGSAIATQASNNCSLIVNLPPSIFPVPLPVEVYEKNQQFSNSGTLAGFTSDLENAINSTLQTQVLGSAISLLGPTGVYQALSGTPGPAPVKASANCEFTLNFPTSIFPIPLPVLLYGATLNITSATLSGVASDLGTAIQKSLAALVVGNSITVTGPTGVYQALGGAPGPGKIVADKDCALTVNLPSIPGTPFSVTVIPNGTQIQTSVDLLATQLGSALSAVLNPLNVNVTCNPVSTASTPGTGLIVVSATTTTGLPVPISFSPPTAALVHDAAAALGLEGVAAPNIPVTCSANTSGSVTTGSLLVSSTVPSTGQPVLISFSPPTAPGAIDAAAVLGLEVSPPSVQVACSLVSTAAGQAIEVTAASPGQADAPVSFTAVPASATNIDAATALGLVAAAGAITLPGPTTVNVAHYTLGSTNVSAFETSSTLAVAMDGLPGADELIGDQLAQSGIYALSKVAFNLLCIPDAVRASAGNPSVLDTSGGTSLDPVAVYSTAITLCVQNRAMLLVDPPPTITTLAAAVDWKTSTIGLFGTPAANGAAFWPRLRLADPLNNSQLRTFAPSGVVAGVYANTDTTRGVWKAPAGIGAALNGVQNMTYQLSDAENGVLNPLGLNCFRTFPVYGPVLWGARTLLGADADTNQWKYVPIRRVALFIEASLYQGTQWVVFEPNDEPLWSAIRLNVGAFMQNLFIEGFFQGQTPTQAYFVKCDSETTTQTDIDAGVVNIVVGFAPLYPAEFVVIQIQQMTGQTTS